MSDDSIWEAQKGYIDASAKYEAHIVGHLLTLLMLGLSIVYGVNIYRTYVDIDRIEKRLNELEAKEPTNAP